MSFFAGYGYVSICCKKIEDSTTYRVGWGCNFLLPYLLKALVALEEAKHLLRQRRMKYAEK
jgi:hypothetical protein